MVRRTAQKNLSVSGQILHLIILAGERKELSGQIFLINLSAQLRTEIIAFTFFVLGNIGRRTKLGYTVGQKFGVGNRIHGLHLSVLDIERFGNLYQIMIPLHHAEIDVFVIDGVNGMFVLIRQP